MRRSAAPSQRFKAPGKSTSVMRKGFQPPRASVSRPGIPARTSTSESSSLSSSSSSSSKTTTPPSKASSGTSSAASSTSESPRHATPPAAAKKTPAATIGEAPATTTPAAAGSTESPASGQQPPKRAKKFVAPSQNMEVIRRKQEADAKELPWRYFSVVWCKFSRKKHKTWAGDALLMVRRTTAILKDMEGKDLAKSTTLKAKDLATLKEGETLFFSGKEVEIMGTISEEDWSTGKCFLGSSTSATPTPNVPQPARRPKAPAFKRVVGGKSGAAQTKQRPKAKPRFDPEAPGALVIHHPAGAQHEAVPVVVDPHLGVHLRPHQREGVQFLWHSIVGRPGVDGTGCILGDEMGLGKTLQCISVIWTALKQGHQGTPLARRIMVVCPGSLVRNWESEFRKWLGRERIKVFVVKADKPVREFANASIYSVLLLSYEMLLRNISDVARLNLDIVVCDEAHRLKNANAKTTMAMMSLRARRRIALTGTPIQNDLQEFFAIVDFCNPGILGSQGTFRRIYEKPILDARQPTAPREERKLGDARAAQLTRMIASFCLRRTKEINLSYLPPKSDYVLFCQPSETQLRLYRALLRTTAVKSCLQGRVSAGSHLVIITALKTLCNSPTILCRKGLPDAALRQASGNGSRNRNGEEEEEEEEDVEEDLVRDVAVQVLGRPALATLDDAEDVSLCGKMQLLDRMLSYWRHHPAKERVLIVSNSTKVLSRVQALCERCQYPFLRLQGNTPTAKRLELVERFNNRIRDDYVFLMSSKAGGVGLNIVGASRLILYDTDWNPANDLQAMARVWRDGQKRHVFVYRLLTTGTIEEKIYQRQVHKQGLSGSVVDKQQGKGGAGSSKASSSSKQVAGFSMEELKDIFSLREDTRSDTWELLEKFSSKEDKSNGSPSKAKRGANSKSASLSLDTLLTWNRQVAPFDTAAFDDEALRVVDAQDEGLLTCAFHTSSKEGKADDPLAALTSGDTADNVQEEHADDDGAEENREAKQEQQVEDEGEEKEGTTKKDSTSNSWQHLDTRGLEMDAGEEDDDDDAFV